MSTRELRDQALAAGVAFVPGPAFYPDPAGESELRQCFSSVLPNAIDDAVRRLAGVSRERCRFDRWRSRRRGAAAAD